MTHKPLSQKRGCAFDCSPCRGATASGRPCGRDCALYCRGDPRGRPHIAADAAAVQKSQPVRAGFRSGSVLFCFQNTALRKGEGTEIYIQELQRSLLLWDRQFFHIF